MAPDNTHQMEPAAAVSACLAGDLTIERVTLKSVLHTEATGLLHLAGSTAAHAGGSFHWRRTGDSLHGHHHQQEK